MSSFVVEGLVCLLAACWMVQIWVTARRDRHAALPILPPVARKARLLATRDLVPPGCGRDARTDCV